MAAFEPEKLEDKYVQYPDELQTAYKNAYQHVHGQYDSALLRSIGRQILDESEPFSEAMASFGSNSPIIRVNGSDRSPSATRRSKPSSRHSSTASNWSCGVSLSSKMLEER